MTNSLIRRAVVRAGIVAAAAVVLTVLGAAQARAADNKALSCPCLFDVAFWTQAAFLDELNSKARVEESCSAVTLDRSTHKTLRMAGPAPLGLGVILEVAHDTGTDGFKADSSCRTRWTVESQRGEGAKINFDEQINFEVTYYEVIAEQTGPYKELMSTLPAAKAGPVSFEACEAALRKIAQSYRVDCKFD
jgi:hypothetical protein